MFQCYEIKSKCECCTNVVYLDANVCNDCIVVDTTLNADGKLYNNEINYFIAFIHNMLMNRWIQNVIYILFITGLNQNNLM